MAEQSGTRGWQHSTFIFVITAASALDTFIFTIDNAQHTNSLLYPANDDVNTLANANMATMSSL